MGCIGAPHTHTLTPRSNTFDLFEKPPMWDKRTLRDFPPLCSGAFILTKYIYPVLQQAQAEIIKPMVVYCLLRGCLYQRTEGVYRDVKGYIVVHQGTSRHIREYRGIPGHTKVYQDYQCITRYIYMGIPRYPGLYKGTVGGQYKVPTLSGGAKAATCPAADNRGGRWASCTTGRQHAQCARFTIIVHIISS